ncbi:deaminase [Arthrobacter sp. MYb227]|uniref:dihydrofolate reductase family protein n=1 Tax=Arthrobacter sp. MYb227 TaxID=1848601 RepID=UPI000CFD6299|nr:dihydrofolate reductase family protein [Arthrobacter sp. MYb227]PQZ94918.1 deaminase [Arthrobacter sp. MYb227]
MRKLTMLNNLTLDGVMQAPGRAEEDTRHGFAAGGWAQSYADNVLGEYLGQGMSTPHELVLGRRTWQDFASFWTTQTDNPFTDLLNNLTKYVASRTLHEPLAWANSKLLDGDAVQAVAELRAQDGPDLLCMGSGNLLQGLMGAGLVDEYTLLLHPLVLGQGSRMFTESLPQMNFNLEEAITTSTGVIIAVYRPEL